MNPLKICFVTSEVAPFVKTGGLADVSSALPQFLHRQGHDVRVFVPLYVQVDPNGAALTPIDGLRSIPLQLGGKSFEFSMSEAPLPGTDLKVYFVRCPALYERNGVYTSDSDEHLRFLLLSRASFECCQRLGWGPDIIHCQDWQTAMIPLFLKSLYAWDRLFERTRTVLTIHNLGYQGAFPAEILGDTGLSGSPQKLHQQDLRAGRINFLKTGILYADLLTTVSPTYAQEIQTEGYGMGLHDFLRKRSDHLVGILNGVDYGEWNPSTDPHIPAHYSSRSLGRKEKNKEALLLKLGLPYTPGAPVVGIVSRLATQKGFDLLAKPLPDLLSQHDLRFVILGTGEPRYVELFRQLQTRFPDKVNFTRGFDNDLAHLIEAGSDLFLMPSRYEPCGLNQMYSLKYGTVPVVRKTGGLADSVQHYDPSTGRGTGFVFEHFTPEGLRWALEVALETFGNPKAWRRLMLNGMACDFSWDSQGKQYLELYARLIANGRSTQESTGSKPPTGSASPA